VVLALKFDDGTLTLLAISSLLRASQTALEFSAAAHHISTYTLQSLRVRLCSVEVLCEILLLVLQILARNSSLLFDEERLVFTHHALLDHVAHWHSFLRNIRLLQVLECLVQALDFLCLRYNTLLISVALWHGVD